MDYISPERSLDGTCGDPGPLFGDQDGSLLEHMDYHDSVPYMNDQIMCNTMKSASTSPASPLKQDEEHHVHIESDMQNDAAEQKVHHNDDCEAHTSSPGYDVHQNTEVVEGVLPPELHESSGNDISNFQQETTHSDVYHGDSMLAENSSRDYQFSNSGDDDDEIPNSSAPQMGNKDNRKLHETLHNEVNGTEDDQMNGGNSNPRGENDTENFNSAIESSYLDGMEQEDPCTENGISTPGNQWDSPPERSAGLEKGTPSPARRVSLSVERSPHAHSSEKLDSPHHAKEGDNLAHSRSPPARRLSRSPGSPENHDTNRRRAPSHELSPHARDNSPERKAQSRRGDGSPRRRSTSPRRRDGSPRRRSASPRRRHGSPRRRSASPKRRDGSPRRRSPSPKRRHGSPRRRSPSPKRRHGSPRRRSPSPKRRASPKRRGSPRRRDSPTRRRDSSPRRRDSSPRKRDSSPRRRESPTRRRDSPARKRDSPTRKRDSPTRKRDRSKSRSPSRKTDSSRHRREHGRSRSRSPHSRSHHRRSPRRRHSPRHRSPPARQHSPKRCWSPPANRKTGLGKPGRNLFVAGFSYATTERELEKKFAKFGRVTRVRVVRDKRTGDSRGFGFLSLEKDEDADAAIRACDETEWNGRIILVEKSKAPAW
ncbi:serine/threonine-protein kinase PRP4 [Hordeum vulgare]|uniref:RRM domain-containing protein n=1 Tax=Hordeum vulgare subsp. vulgare TaxID=112509 RepID=A0A8I6X7G5_HORVV|nr:serine/arginine repetitive matrix protein 1-like isoform X2 [Hordeum vulgare subsp. vulgare]KAE8809035.1 serine/threonine-protein kinase PRP4 [Hordeum vulgare]